MGIQEVKEHREDGSLQYECTKRMLSKSEAYLFPNHIEDEEGNFFIRINYATKYKLDGSIEWRLIYNDNGYVIGNKRGIKQNFNI